jgi:vacuolar-type H+-ATPase subunit I/STV1
MSRNKFVFAFILALGLCLPVMGVHAASGTALGQTTIKKCKDATGQWHYGDSAAEECARSKVTVMSEEGMTKKVIAAPPTEQELKEHEARQEIEAAEKQRAADQVKKDALLLSTYGGEDDIIYIRDRKIAQIESSIKASEETLKNLRAALARMEAQAADESKGNKAADQTTVKNIEQTKKQIARHEGVVADKRKEQEALRKQYADEMQRYREIKKNQAAKTPVTAVKK